PPGMYRGAPPRNCQTCHRFLLTLSLQKDKHKKEEAERRIAGKGKRRMAEEVSSTAGMLRGKAGMGRGGAEKPSEEEVVDLEVKLPAGWERRLDLP
uniref:Uncharacterized protein n=1 Tax=Aegilops tauschii subsp. strangulata TaxID=200361 RepID=A0A453CWR1_AEGTS